MKALLADKIQSLFRCSRTSGGTVSLPHATAVGFGRLMLLSIFTTAESEESIPTAVAGTQRPTGAIVKRGTR